MKSWNLREIETPAGSRSPVVLHSGESRAVLIALDPGQSLGDHEVKEQAFVTVIEGRVRVQAGAESIEAEAGALFFFEPAERHAVASDSGARLLMLLSPWPGAGHYRGEERELGSA